VILVSFQANEGQSLHQSKLQAATDKALCSKAIILRLFEGTTERVRKVALENFRTSPQKIQKQEKQFALTFYKGEKLILLIFLSKLSIELLFLVLPLVQSSTKFSFY